MNSINSVILSPSARVILSEAKNLRASRVNSAKNLDPSAFRQRTDPPSPWRTPQDDKGKPNKTAIFLMAVLILAFSYIIIKDVVLPAWVLASAVVVGGGALLAVSLNRPQVVTYLLVAYLPFSKVLVGDFGGLATAFNFTNLLMGFIFLVWMTGRYSEGEPIWLRTSLNLPILLFTLMGCLSIVRGNYYGSDYIWFAVVAFKRWITPILMFFLVLNTVKDRATIKNIITIMIIATTIVGLMAIYEYIEVGDSSLEKSRIGGISEHSNSLAAFFNYYIFLPFGFFLVNINRFRYWLLLIPFLIQFRGIMVTFSRGGYMAFALGLFAITFFRSKILLLLLLMATWFAFMNPILLPAGIRFRMGQTFEGRTNDLGIVEEAEGSLDTSARNRVEVWKGALQMIQDQPFFGIGYGLFFYTIAAYWTGGFAIDAHNTYLIIAAEMGLPALLVFLWIVFAVLWHTYRLYRTTQDPFAKAVALGFLGGLFGLLLSNMFGSRLDSQEVSSYFWILSALIMRLKILEEKEAAPL